MRSSLLFRRWRRVLLTLIPLALALCMFRPPCPAAAGAAGPVHLRRPPAPGDVANPDERIVIVDIDEKSIDRIGRWPWGRDKLADLTQELFARQRVSVVGFDVVFAERDNSSGWHPCAPWAGPWPKLQALPSNWLAWPFPDHDALFARSLHGHAAVLGYYFTSDRQGHTKVRSLCRW